MPAPYVGVSPYNASSSAAYQSMHVGTDTVNEMENGGPGQLPFATFRPPQSILGTPLAVWLGMVAVLVGFKFLSEHDGNELDPKDIRIGGYNLLAVGVTATVFIVLAKVIFNRFPVKGLTDVFNFV